MKLTLKRIALAALVATTELAGVASAQAPIDTTAPEDWVVYDDVTVSSEVDEVTRHLTATREAFEASDSKKAAAELRAVADELKAQAGKAPPRDNARTQATIKLGQDIATRLEVTARQVDDAAAALESGTIKAGEELDKVIDMAARANMDRRWEVTDVATRYPLSEEPQRHFADAMAEYSSKDYKAAAADIRKANAFVRLEAGRATGEGRQDLDRSVAQLDQLAASVEKGSVTDEQSMQRYFATASHAIALAHQSKAAESWARKGYDQAGHELGAAAHGLESAAGWAGVEAKESVSAVVADTRAIGEKLASGAAWTRDEVAKGFEMLGNAINALTQKRGGTEKVSPLDVGSR